MLEHLIDNSEFLYRALCFLAVLLSLIAAVSLVWWARPLCRVKRTGLKADLKRARKANAMLSEQLAEKNAQLMRAKENEEAARHSADVYFRLWADGHGVKQLDESGLWTQETKNRP